MSATYKCTTCGAVVPPSQAACSYCGTPSAEGIRQQQQAHVQADAQATALAAHMEHDHARAEAQLQANAKLAFTWAIVGLLLCCVPIPSIVALVLALRTHRTARAHDAVVPGRATLALVLSILSIVWFAAMIVYYYVDARVKDTRAGELRAKVERTWTRPVLDHDTACGLVELAAIESGFEGRTWDSGDGFRCDGRLDQTGEKAVLHDARLQRGPNGEAVVLGCLKRGERWMVDKILREGASCEPAAEPPAPPPPPPSAAPTPSAKVKKPPVKRR